MQQTRFAFHIFHPQFSKSADACSSSSLYGPLPVIDVFMKQFANRYAVRLASNVTPWHVGDLPSLLYVLQLLTQPSKLYCSDWPMFPVEEAKSTRQYSSKE